MERNDEKRETGETMVVRTDRPHMPAGYLPAEEKGTLLPWRHAQQRLEEAVNYWIVTVRPDGRPHVMPVWGVWLDDKLYFSSSPQTRHSRNLGQNPVVSVHLESGEDVVIVEGTAHEYASPPRAVTVRVAKAYSAKYAASGYAPEAEEWDDGGLYVVQPSLALGWDSFPDHCTRWHFDER
jgi:PPOX class probable F420-dependent enzyme